MTEMARLLSAVGNYAVVQLPGRSFPGVFFQGDTAHIILSQVQAIRTLAGKYGDDDLNAEIGDLHELLTEVSELFERVCAREGIRLPYEK